MPSKIRVLDEITINQIAAGEVIENPASVVKELVENSLDAGATRLTIEIKAGGFQLIRITDNGEGMSPDDALLAFERHGTSKIQRVDDLAELHSLGFRGEALASILSVSQMTLLTSDGQTATEVEGAGGKILKVKKGSRAQGTTIEVRSLFYNVPARRSFQKSPSRSTAEIAKMVTKLALARPDISFQFISNESEMFHLSESPAKKRATQLINEAFTEAAQEVALESDNLTIRGLLGCPTQARSSRSGQFLFLNGRAVYCHPISCAIEEAYATRLSPRQYPQFLLYIDLPSGDVDVNVHPQKREVRLKNEESVKEAVRRLVATSWDSPPQLVDCSPVENPFTLREEPRSYQSFNWRDAPRVVESTPLIEQATLFQEPPYEILTLFHHFLFVKEEDRLSIVDLKAATEALITKRGDEEVSKQGLLVPLTFEFSRHEALRLEEEIDYLNKIGIGIRPFGERSFIVESLNDLIDASCVEPLLHELLSGPERSRSLTRSLRARRRSFTMSEAKRLYEELKAVNVSSKCLVEMGDKEIEKLIQTT